MSKESEKVVERSRQKEIARKKTTQANTQQARKEPVNTAEKQDILVCHIRTVLCMTNTRSNQKKNASLLRQV